MITDSMNHEEVCREVSKDYQNVSKYLKWKCKDANRLALKATRFPCFYSLEWTSPQKNKWLIHFIFFRRNVHNGGCAISAGCLQKYPKGFALHQTALTRDGYDYITTYLPHFFERYAERCNVKTTGVELIKHFMRKNFGALNDDTRRLSGKNSRDIDSIHMCYNEGVGMGEIVADDHVVLKTFITYDMTNRLQKDVFESKRTSNEGYAAMHMEAYKRNKRDF